MKGKEVERTKDNRSVKDAEVDHLVKGVELADKNGTKSEGTKGKSKNGMVRQAKLAKSKDQNN